MKAFALVRTLVIGTIFLSIWLWWLPRWMGWPMHVVHAEAWAVFGFGLAIATWCAVEFALRGLGTPAPFDPPKRLVVTGLYRFVRNPMYVGLGIALIGEAWLTGRIEIIYEMLVLLVAVTVFVLFQEEPALRRTFGDDYVDYCRNVGRWIPRLTPWYPSPHLE
jgi:protein-S-isoprenylcysteine O-methyltransferase Ste14